MRYRCYVFILLTALSGVGCATKKIKDVSYLTENRSEPASPKLNIFTPRHTKNKKLPVLIFVHGGNWNTGNKNTYGFFGRNFARKNVITIIPDYTLSPGANYDVMAREIADVIRWTQQNIAKYGGDASRIFITGHSAGGHLAALSVMNPKYEIEPSAIAGIILNDAAGLDMRHYLEENPPESGNDYTTTWTTDPEKWQDASPIYFLNKETPPFMIYVGDKTYESIKIANQRFLAALKPFQPSIVPIRVNKSHIPMILQYFWPWSSRFDETLHFINRK